MIPVRKFSLDEGWLGRLANTLFVLCLAVLVAWMVWRYYLLTPWTRDGRVRAETVNAAAEVYGKVQEIPVVENQYVHKGDILFTIDPYEFKLDVDKAAGLMEARRQEMLISQTLAQRRQGLDTEAISREEQQTSQSAAATAQAAYAEARAQWNLARLNLDRTVIRSPVNGYVNNLRLRVGDFATIGQTKLSVIDSDSFWISGYFEETKIPRIHEGDSAEIELMGMSETIRGHVESICRGIADSNGEADTQGMQKVNPVFYWVRLAQRIPVRIHIDHVPQDLTLAAGMTCTVVIQPRKLHE